MRKISTLVLAGFAAAGLAGSVSAQDLGAFTTKAGASAQLPNQQAGMRLNPSTDPGAQFASADTKPRPDAGGFSTASADDGAMNPGFPKGPVSVSQLADSPDISRALNAGGFSRAEPGQTADGAPPAVAFSQTAPALLGLDASNAGNFAAGPAQPFGVRR